MSGRSPALEIPQREKTYLTLQGRLMQVKNGLNYHRTPQLPKRGKIQGFTRQARGRMLREIATIDWQHYGPSILVTLTYPDEYADRTPRQRTLDRSRFLRDIEDHMGHSASVLWRLEYKARKTGKHVGRIVPHYHLIYLGVRYLDKSIVRKTWRAILKCKGPLATDVRLKKKTLKAAQYTAKYISKQDSLSALDNCAYLNSLGRAWGLTRKVFVRRYPQVAIRSMSEAQLARAMEVAGQLLGKRYVGSFYLIREDVGALAAYVAGDPGSLVDTGIGG